MGHLGIAVVLLVLAFAVYTLAAMSNSASIMRVALALSIAAGVVALWEK